MLKATPFVNAIIISGVLSLADAINSVAYQSILVTGHFVILILVDLGHKLAKDSRYRFFNFVLCLIGVIAGSILAKLAPIDVLDGVAYEPVIKSVITIMCLGVAFIRIQRILLDLIDSYANPTKEASTQTAMTGA